MLVAAAAPSVYYFRQYQKVQQRLNNPTQAAKKDAAETIAAVGRLMLLPANEEPTVMQVTDVSKLKDQPFFANALNGDKVLIYAKSKKAILYRLTTNKIIDVAPVNIGSTTPTVSPAPSVEPAPTKTATPSSIIINQ